MVSFHYIDQIDKKKHDSELFVGTRHLAMTHGCTAPHGHNTGPSLMNIKRIYEDKSWKR